MRYFVGLDYSFPEPGNQTIVAAATVLSFDMPPLTFAFSTSIEVLESDNTQQINNRIADTFVTLFEMEHSITIGPGDKLVRHGAFLIE